jgi:hypothetical protein
MKTKTATATTKTAKTEDTLGFAIETLELNMWALVTKLASTPYDGVDDQLADAEKLGKIAGELRTLRLARSIAERTKLQREAG